MKIIKNPVLFYVDDDEDDLMIFEEAAKELGVRVHLFNNGDKLLEALETTDIESLIIFVDLNMPEKSGFEVIYEIRDSKFWNQLPVVVLSTASDNFNIEKARITGASLYMRKFTDFNKLINALKMTMGRDWSDLPIYEEFVYAV